ncbi:MAG: hypothetical protein OEY18_03220 [Candidatus Aminicenantes bacterium]|nr:hypothetical protein [Candidatus Aminicenantes bacterium]MDH5383697.1 hypothetical protein [Candidatus Aminicenantes bacterium]MDH5742082.1 hypothetical protein [Candidatus Aminicenantes bacterium]
MDKDIKTHLSSFEFGDLQHFKNMAVLPLMTSLDDSPEYLTLKQALEGQMLVISEATQEGRVPELKVMNKGEIPVLLLDGEELAGAKQNRVLNTTILLKEKSETVIPVSCTEQRRWSYTSREFSESGTVMIPKIRKMKSQTVSDSLQDSREYRSDQGTVWTSIEEMSERAEVHSQTAAMSDVYEAKAQELDEYLQVFTCLPQQRGLLTFMGGEVVGFDFLSLNSAYALLHPKLVKSYAMEAILQKSPKTEKPDVERAKDFLKEASQCKEKKYESVGKGWDHRFEGKTLVGSALKVERKVIHMAFFRITESEKAGNIAGFRRRREFRTG